MSQFKLIPHKSKAWGVVPIPDQPGHFFTGWEHERVDTGSKTIAARDLMLVGQNAVITGKFKMETMGRGRSAANFYGRFQGSGVRYELGMRGALDILLCLQMNTHRIVSEHIWGEWTFSKQGQSILLTPVLPS